MSSILDLILGDPSQPEARVPSYEESHAEAQSILLPTALQKGLSVQVLHPLSKNFALNYRMLLESGKPSSAGNPFAAMMGGGPPQVRGGAWRGVGARRR